MTALKNVVGRRRGEGEGGGEEGGEGGGLGEEDMVGGGGELEVHLVRCVSAASFGHGEGRGLVHL